MSLNKCFMIGNLTRDPELRKLARSGTSVCDMTIAVNRKHGEQDDTAFVDVTIWGKLADNCNRYLAKGSQVLVEGYLKQESWEDKQTGAKRSKLKIVAETIQFLNTGGSKSNGNAGNECDDYQHHEPIQTGRYSAEDRPAPRPVTDHDIAKGNGYQPQNDDDIPF